MLFYRGPFLQKPTARDRKLAVDQYFTHIPFDGSEVDNYDEDFILLQSSIKSDHICLDACSKLSKTKVKVAHELDELFDKIIPISAER